MTTAKERVTESKNGHKPVSKEAHENNLRALAALRRASIEARRRAIETTGYVATWRNGEMVYDTEVNPCCCRSR